MLYFDADVNKWMKEAEIDSDDSSSDFSSLDGLDIVCSKCEKQLDHDQQDEDLLDDALFSVIPLMINLPLINLPLLDLPLLDHYKVPAYMYTSCLESAWYINLCIDH